MIVVDRAAAAIVEQQGEVLAPDRLPPPFVFDDPGVLDALDEMDAAIDDDRDRAITLGRDLDRERLVQGS